ncbi:MAG: peptide-methionine (S)-S-oxide reductase MsrA [Rhodospirillales bacterium]
MITVRRFSPLILSCCLLAAVALSGPAVGHAADSADATAIFAGGCFWCVESDFDKVPGVVKTVSGYIGGTVKNPTYRQVTAGGTGHREAVKIIFDPGKVTYEHLLHVFWRSIDPTDGGGQFCDRGESYKSAIFTSSVEQRRLAESSKKDVAKKLNKPVATTVEQAGTFYPAEGYHQNYYEENPIRYNFYRSRCGRDARIRDVWGDEAFSGIKGH